ncbi:TonB-dependent receptor [Sediminibacterium sp.]|uniref:TonB-dependent receptor n=1 Tax=Sediminibacterium sp. TaxID=1917865 RepID=UPI002600FBC4|nr:TonB-dependent receptor [Sediminibacterium sp.]MBT9484930.1 outer membrane beta-barrel protein [Sediminibacterium sp.]
MNIYGIYNKIHLKTNSTAFMTRLTLILLCLIAGISTSFAQQNGSVKGLVTDTLNKQNLTNAVVSVLRAKDSVLVKFTRTNTEGNFNLPNLSAGKYIVMVTYPSYADYIDIISVTEGSITDLGKVPVITKATLLQEVIVKQTIGSIRMKGDTTEYKADSFKVSANADVQELLRKMPGIQVNSKGEITAQGERVQKVLVDGEEFFSDDPAVVTKNLRADAVDKVQSFDKKSDQAVFTGIDDGQKIKTLNLTLKEDKKKGYFGKAEAGGDFDKYGYGKLLANSFKGKRKISGYLTTDNTKFESLNWNENQNYGGNSNMTTEMTDDGGIMMWSSGDEFSWGTGFPRSITGGLHFSNKWNKDKHNSNNTYQFNQLDVSGINSNKTQNILPGADLISTSIQNQASSRKRNKLTSTYEWQIDSSSSLKITARGSIVNSNSASNYFGRTINSDSILLNQSNRLTSTVDENKTMNSTIFYRKRFKKAGRTISWNNEINYNDRADDGFLTADNTFYDAFGNLVRRDLVDQQKTNKQIATTINSTINYTEPLWKNTFLVLNYKLSVSRNDAERNTFAKNAANNKYENLVDTLSNHFIFNTTGHNGSVNIRYNVKKFNFSIGTGLGTVNYRLNDLVKKTDRNVIFNNFIPAVTFNYTPKQQRRFNFSYNGSTRNPSLSQIQPIIDNIDPLNLTIGNPNLKQSFVHQFNLGGSDYKVLKSRRISFNVNFSKTENAISNSSFVDNQGRRINQAINVAGNYSLSGRVGYGFEIIPSFNVGLDIGPRINQFANRVNGIDNITKNRSTDFSINMGYWGDKWINFYAYGSAVRNNSTTSIRPDISTKFWSYNAYANLQFKLKKIKTYIDFDLNANIYEKTAVFADQRDVYIVNASARKVISKNDQWEIKASVNDLFNQNLGINRNASSNFITETTNQTIQRYFLFSLIWNFSKNGKPNEGF